MYSSNFGQAVLFRIIIKIHIVLVNSLYPHGQIVNTILASFLLPENIQFFDFCVN